MNKRSVIICISVVMLFVQYSFSQINLLADEITFRTPDEQNRVTYHNGNIKISGLGNATEGSIVYSEFNSSDYADRYAFYGVSTPQPWYGIGAYFLGGWKGVVGSASANGSGYRYGGIFTGFGGSSANYGVYAKAECYNYSPTSYGIYATANGYGTKYAGYFNGNVHVTGIITTPSDVKLKKDITPLNGSLEKILKLKPKKYFYKTDDFKQLELPKNKKCGLIAQEVEAVLPEIVTYETMPLVDIDENGNKIPADQLKKPEKYKSVNYLELIPVLINAIQEQQKEIDILKAQMGLD